MKKILIAMALLGATASYAQQKSLNTGVYGVVGTGGVGLGLAVQTAPEIVFRGELASYTRSVSTSEDGIDYDGKARLVTAAILADYHVFGGPFRMSFGLNFKGPDARLQGVTNGGLVTVNGRAYPVAPGESISATIKFPSVQPYIGIGWGLGDLSKPGFLFGADIGANFGRAKGDLTASNGLQAIPGFNADFAEQERKFRDSVSDLRFFPVVKVSVGYAF